MRILSTITLASLLLSSCSKKEPASEDSNKNAQGARNVETTLIARANMTSTLSLVGSIEANESADIRTELAGNLIEVFFDEGKPVAKGQKLAKIDDREIIAQLKETEAQLPLATQTRDRYQRLIKTKSIPQADLDQAESELATLQATADRLRVRLSKTTITAPFTGTAGARNVSPGDFIDPTKSITNVVDVSKLKINFYVPERYYSQLKLGGKINLRLGINGELSTVTGTIYFISSVIDPATRSAQVKAWIDTPPTSLIPGMFTNVDLILETRENTLTVPEQALLASAKGDALIVLGPATDGAHPITIVPVKTGLRELGRVEISPIIPDSIKEGSQIVAAGVGGLPLFPGTTVKPLPMRPDPVKTGDKLQTGTYKEILNPPSKDNKPSATENR